MRKCRWDFDKDFIESDDCFEFHALSKQPMDSVLLEAPREFPMHNLVSNAPSPLYIG